MSTDTDKMQSLEAPTPKPTPEEKQTHVYRIDVTIAKLKDDGYQVYVSSPDTDSIYWLSTRCPCLDMVASSIEFGMREHQGSLSPCKVKLNECTAEPEIAEKFTELFNKRHQIIE